MAAPSSFTRAAALADVRDGFATLVKVAGKPVLLTRRGDAVHAFSGMCTHAAFMLGTSRLTKSCAIECPVHGALFDATTGIVTKGPAIEPLPCLDVRVEDDVVLVRADWAETE